MKSEWKSKCISTFCPSFPAIYLLYAKLEEEYGLARHAMAVYERSTQAVEPEERHLMFNIYIKRAAEIYGVTHTRAIYQKAIEVRCCPCITGCRASSGACRTTSGLRVYEVTRLRVKSGHYAGLEKNLFQRKHYCSQVQVGNKKNFFHIMFGNFPATLRLQTCCLSNETHLQHF